MAEPDDLIVRCAVCGKATVGGRFPRDGRYQGDGSFRYPRRHKIGGIPCPGNFEEGIWELRSETSREV